jgi:hypothetical protein
MPAGLPITTGPLCVAPYEWYVVDADAGGGTNTKR